MKISVSKKRATLKETEAILNRVLASRQKAIKGLAMQRENPSVAPMYYTTKAQVELLEDILNFIDGNPVGLNVLAE